MRAAVYLRQSEDRDDDQLAISRQREDCHQLCATRGWDPVDYVDNDVSAIGAKRKRPAWDQMLADMEAGTVQAMVCWDLDRLYREPIDLEYLIPLADRMKVALATVTGDVDLSTDSGRMFARIKGAVARAEVDRRSARQKRRAKQMADAGEQWTSKRPFGYEWDGQIREAEAAELRLAYELVLGGHSMNSIIKDWNARGIRTSMGNPWTAQTLLRKILLNPRNAGLRAYRGEIVGQARWPAIVELDVWEAVKHMLEDPSRRATPNPGKRFLLTGIALCGRCGGRMQVARNYRRPPSGMVNKVFKTVYRCRECFGVGRLQEPIDEYVIQNVIGRLAQQDAAELLIDQKRPDVDRMRSEAAALRERLESLATDYADGLLTREQMRTGTARAKERLERVEAQMMDGNRARLFKDVVGRNAERFRTIALQRQRAIVDALTVVTIHPARRRGVFDLDTIEVAWKDPN